MNIFKKIKEQIFNSDVHIRKRLFVLSVAITLIALMVIFIEIMLTDENIWDGILLGTGILITGIIAWLAVKYNKITFAGIWVSVLMGFVYVPVSFFAGGGMHGDAPLWFLFSTLFMSMILKGKVKLFFLLSEAVLACVCYYLGYTHPEYVLPNTERMAHQYSLIALILTGIAVSLMIELEIRLYIRESRRTDQQKKEIEALNASQNQFFSSMSHEIRTPINTIIGLNEMILREDISDEVAEDAANIRASSKLLLSLINDILDMSKFQSGRMQLTPAPYQLNNMLSDLVGMFWLRAKEKGLEFHVNVAPDLPADLIGDDVRIRQVLINVLNNAIKYTKEGSVTLAVQCSSVTEENAVLVFSIADTGMGIKKEDIPYLFTAFKRVDEEHNRHIEGTGLGLSIVKNFVDMMGGSVRVNSIYTEGSTFIIEIPQKLAGERRIGDTDLEKKHATMRQEGYRQRFEAPEARVLVVDDNASNLMVVTKLLRSTKIRIDTASGGEEALRKTINTAYHVIFMDHLMPEMDGIEAFHGIRNQTGGLCKASRVVILTANADEENRALYAKEGFDGYLTKPVTGEQLENELIRLLPAGMVYMTGDNGEILEETVSWMKTSKSRKQVVITTESVADLPEELAARYGIRILPHKVRTGEGVFQDGLDIDTRGVLRYMENPDNMVQPLAPDVKEHEMFFAKALTNANNIIHISISEEVEQSGCPFAREAADAFENVTVFDSGHLSSGQGLLALMAAKAAEEGHSRDEILEMLTIEKRRIHTSFIVDSMDYLTRTKQVGPKIAALTKAMMLRPVLALKRGKMTVADMKVGSREDAWRKYIHSCLRNPAKIDTSILFVTYVGLTKKNMDWIREEVEKRVHFDEIYFQLASPAIASNCGPGTFGLLFRGRAERDYQ
ncbi:MAG: DegV family EDD domain-containing protein [Eubacterium sp.]|nr:DegV family EDD domain-containing protein [Eubacterium sp.]